jgi:hypothetical protein
MESTNHPPAVNKKHRAPRIPIVVTGSVREKYQQLANARGCSLSRAMSDWLADSLEGVEVITRMVEEGRRTPHKLAADALAIASSLRVAADEVIDRATAAAVTNAPRPSNTGGKSTPRPGAR